MSNNRKTRKKHMKEVRKDLYSKIRNIKITVRPMIRVKDVKGRYIDVSPEHPVYEELYKKTAPYAENPNKPMLIDLSPISFEDLGWIKK